MSLLARLAYTFLTGYILTFYSEWMFWSGRPPSEIFFLEAIPSWIAYSFITFLFLTAVTYFRVQSLWAVFLAGAAFAWRLPEWIRAVRPIYVRQGVSFEEMKR